MGQFSIGPLNGSLTSEGSATLSFQSTGASSGTLTISIVISGVNQPAQVFNGTLNPDSTYTTTASGANTKIAIPAGPFAGSYTLNGGNYNPTTNLARGSLSSSIPGDPPSDWQASGAVETGKTDAAAASAGYAKKR